MYRLEISAAAKKSLRDLGQPLQGRVDAAILALSDNPRPSGCTKLKGSPARRIPVGDYRIIYEIAEHILVVTVINLGHRRGIYR